MFVEWISYQNGHVPIFPQATTDTLINLKDVSRLGKSTHILNSSSYPSISM